ncbi:putative 4-coumarate--CoA ligase 2 [Ixodes scapularis]
MKRYAAGFQALGIQPEERVCVHIGNNAENIAVLYGLVFAGATVVLAHTSMNEGELCYQLNDSDCSLILTEPPYASKVLKVKEQLNLKGIYVLGEAAGLVSVSHFRNLDENDFREVPVADPREALISPLLLFRNHGGSQGGTLCYEKNDVLLAWNPITYASGFMFTIVAACMGSTCVMVNPSIPFEEFVRYSNKFQVTTVASSPTGLQYLLGQMKRTGVRPESICKINVGGTLVTEALAKNVVSVFKDLRCLRNIYGLSESCGVVCAPPADQINFGNIGFPGPMVELKFIDLETGEKLGPNKEGELYFRIPSVMKGYHNMPEKTAEFIDSDGWCRSGDIAWYDEDGRVYYVDRIKDMIKCLDHQVSPSDLERVLQSHEDVADAAVVGVPHVQYGDMPVAFVVLRNSSGCPEDVAEKLKDFVAGKTPYYKHIYGGVFIMDRLPRNVNGKVLKQQLKLLYNNKTSG